VVPRRAYLGEHVDDHQSRFAQHMHARGLAVLADRWTTFVQQLDRWREDPAAFLIPAAAPATAHTAQRIEQELGRLVSRRAGSR
jgi:hypothetical protein